MSRFLPEPMRPHVIQLAVLATAMHAGSAWAVEPFVLKDIRVEGLQRTDPGTVFAALPFRIGDTYNDEKGAARCVPCLPPACSRTCGSTSTPMRSSW
jgi:outer membrane protein insertion porin family